MEITIQPDVDVSATVETQRDFPTTTSGDVITTVAEPSSTPPTESETSPPKTTSPSTFSCVHVYCRS